MLYSLKVETVDDSSDDIATGFGDGVEKEWSHTFSGAFTVAPVLSPDETEIYIGYAARIWWQCGWDMVGMELASVLTLLRVVFLFVSSQRRPGHILQREHGQWPSELGILCR